MATAERWVGALVAAVLVAGLAAVSARTYVARPAAAAAPVAAAAPAPSPEPACTAWDQYGQPTAPPAAVGDPLAPDRGALTGTLANGLRYVVRHNEHPGANAELRLVVDAGSALEDADQAGAAHFVEHMLFNGTERFPGNELTKTLSSLGLRLGPDLNARTSYDDTQYRLSISSDRAKLATALDVLYQWAAKATIAPDAVDAERGVILQEEAARDETAAGRRAQHEDHAILDGTAYAGHDPIGTVDSIKSMSAAAIKRFYTDWYRPDLMAVVAVGDFDAQAMRDQIVQRFGALPAAAPTARPRPPLPSAAGGRPARIDSFTDPEATFAGAEVVFTTDRTLPQTADVVRARAAASVAVMALHDRMADDASRGRVPYYRADTDDSSSVRALQSWAISIAAEPDQLRGALSSEIAEIARARQWGLTADELGRAVAEERRAADSDLRNAASRQDSAWADLESAALLTGIDLPAAQAAHDGLTDALASLKVADVDAALRSLTACENLAVLATTPDSFPATLPGNDEILALLGQAGGAPQAERPPEPPVPGALMDRPDPAAVVHEEQHDVYGPATELTFANGARVVINPTPATKDGVVFGALSPGGLSAVADADVADAKAAPDIVDASGVGDLDAVQLRRALADHVVSLSSAIDDATEGFHGSAATEDLETLLQLVHLRMTRPRADDGAVQAELAANRVAAADPQREPDTARARALDQVRFGDAPRERSVPTVDDLAAITGPRALAAYTARFGDASDFVFVIAGGVDVDTAKDLARRYLGTLPGTGRQERWPEERPQPPKLPASVVVTSGHGTEAWVTIVYDVPGTADAATRAHADLLSALLEQRLVDRVREALSATYAPRATVAVRDRPDVGIETTIDLKVAASRADEVVRAIDAATSSVATSGPTGEELAAAVAQEDRAGAYYSNELVAQQWLVGLTSVSGAVSNGSDVVRAADATTPADLAAFAAQVWPAERRVEVLVAPPR